MIVVSIPDWSITPFSEDRDRTQIAADIDVPCTGGGCDHGEEEGIQARLEVGPAASHSAPDSRLAVDRALSERDAAPLYGLRDFSSASGAERIELVRIVHAEWWVADSDEYVLKRIWNSFGRTTRPWRPRPHRAQPASRGP